MPGGRRQYDCGVVCHYSAEDDLVVFGDALAGDVGTGLYGFAIVYFSKTAFGPEAVAAVMREKCPGLDYAACSTAGEITPHGLADGQIVVVLLPIDAFQVKATLISGIAGSGIQCISSRTAAAKREFLETIPPDRQAGVFAMCLIDGMSYAEESVTAAIHWALDDIPLLGGSVGDDLNFQSTILIDNGVIESDCAIVLLIASTLPTRIFKTEAFVPTDIKLVVTRSDPDRRIVHELNAAPAAAEYAALIGSDPASLSPLSFASHPLVVRVGGEYFCRSIQKVNEDGSLSFFCAIDDGVVLTVAEPTGMVDSTQQVFDETRNALGTIDFVLGFDCVLRQIDARNRQVLRPISEVYRDNHVIGFNTYGEQYGSMHLNQTFTGIAFGRPGSLAGDFSTNDNPEADDGRPRH